LAGSPGLFNAPPASYLRSFMLIYNYSRAIKEKDSSVYTQKPFLDA